MVPRVLKADQAPRDLGESKVIKGFKALKELWVLRVLQVLLAL
jgi:hypothetical protein